LTTDIVNASLAIAEKITVSLPWLIEPLSTDGEYFYIFAIQISLMKLPITRSVFFKNIKIDGIYSFPH